VVRAGTRLPVVVVLALALTLGALATAQAHSTVPDPANDPLHVRVGALYPSPGSAYYDRPPVYTNGCHVTAREATYVRFCGYGDPHGSKVMVVFGDSHLAQWWYALDRSAKEKHWKLLWITKSACPAQSLTVRVWEQSFVYGACNVWRKKAITAIRGLPRVDLLVMGGYYGHQVVRPGTNTKITSITEKAAAWQAGTDLTVRKLKPKARQIVIFRDTPLHRFDPGPCVSSTGGNAATCSTRRSVAIPTQMRRAEARVAAAYERVHFADFTPLICSAWCRPVTSANMLRYRDESHLTVSFTKLLVPYVKRALVMAMNHKDPGIMTR